MDEFAAARSVLLFRSTLLRERNWEDFACSVEGVACVYTWDTGAGDAFEGGGFDFLNTSRVWDRSSDEGDSSLMSVGSLAADRCADKIVTSFDPTDEGSGLATGDFREVSGLETGGLDDVSKGWVDDDFV